MGILNFMKELAVDMYKDSVKQQQNIERRYAKEASRLEGMSDEELRKYAKKQSSNYKSNKQIEGVACVDEMKNRGFGEEKRYK